MLLRPRSFSPQSTSTYKPHEAAGGAGEHNQGGRLRGREHDPGLPLLFAWLPVMGTRGFGLKAQGKVFWVVGPGFKGLEFRRLGLCGSKGYTFGWQSAARVSSRERFSMSTHGLVVLWV